MAGVLLRLSERSRATLSELAARTGETQQVVIERALVAYRRQEFFGQMDQAYARLHADPAAWADEQRERDEWEATLADGLDRPGEPGTDP